MAVQPFVQSAGLTAQMTGEPGDLFSLFFTLEIIKGIVKETNPYAALCLQGKEEEWSTSEQEIRAYFGYALIASRISRKRFEEIKRYLHFVDKLTLRAHGHSGYHGLQLIKPVVDTLRARLSAVYTPRCQLSVDEAMISFKGEGRKLY